MIQASGIYRQAFFFKEENYLAPISLSLSSNTSFSSEPLAVMSRSAVQWYFSSVMQPGRWGGAVTRHKQRSHTSMQLCSRGPPDSGTPAASLSSLGPGSPAPRGFTQSGAGGCTETGRR